MTAYTSVRDSRYKAVLACLAALQAVGSSLSRRAQRKLGLVGLRRRCDIWGLSDVEVQTIRGVGRSQYAALSVFYGKALYVREFYNPVSEMT